MTSPAVAGSAGLCASADSSWRKTLFFVALTASAVIAPFLFVGTASGHDIQFHLSSWMDVAGQWRQGILYPRWAEWANWGFGEPRFIFYPPASWLIGAAIGSLLPWKAAAGAYVWLVLLLSGMSMWRLAREWLPASQARAAAVLFAANPYNLATVYYRSDFAELLGVALLPLLVREAVRVVRRERGATISLAFIFGAIWLCNAPEGVIASYSLALLVAVASIRNRDPKPLISGGFGIVAGFALSAFYILPALWEERWVQISQAFATNLRAERNFLFTASGDPEFLLFNWKISTVAVGMMIAACIAAVFVARRRKDLAEITWALFALGIAASFLMIWPSAPLWRHLPELAALQFPWRWLGPIAVVFAFLLAAALGLLREGWAWKTALSALLVAMGIAGLLIGRGTWWNGGDAEFLQGEIQSGHDYEGTDEYTPLGCDRYQLPGATPDAEEVPDVPPTPPVRLVDATSGKFVSAPGKQIEIQEWTSEHKVFSASEAAPVTLALRLVNYPAWEIQIDGKTVQPESADMTGEMLLPLEAGRHRVDIRFRRTWDRTAGDAISLLSVIGLIGYAWALRRSEQV